MIDTISSSCDNINILHCSICTNFRESTLKSEFHLFLIEKTLLLGYERA